MSPTIFTGDQYDRAYPKGIECHWWNLARNTILLRVLKIIPEAKTKIVEVGCGRGIVVNALRTHGFDCDGVELAKVEPLRSVQNFVHTGICAEDLSEEARQSYNVLLLLDVIEHIEDPSLFLSDLLVLFPNLSHVLLTIPARQELWSNYDDYYGHYLRYNLDSLNQMSAKLPVDIVRWGYFFHSLYLPMWLLNFFGWRRETSLSPPSRLIRWLHSCFSTCMFLDFYLLPKRLPGTSLLAIFSINKELLGATRD